MDTYTVFPADRGLSDAQYETLRALEEGRLTQADQRVGVGGREEELLDLEAAGLVKSHPLHTDQGEELVWVVTKRGRHVLRSIGTYKLPAQALQSSSPASGVPLIIVMVVAVVTGIVAVGIAAGWW